MSKTQTQLKKLKEAKALLKKAATLLKDFDSILCSELIHAPGQIDEVIDMVKNTNLYGSTK